MLHRVAQGINQINALPLILVAAACLLTASVSTASAAKWEVTEDVLANKPACILTHVEAGSSAFILVTEGSSAGITVLFEGKRISRKTAFASISSGSLNLVDPHSNFEPPGSGWDVNSVYLEGPLEQVVAVLEVMIENYGTASLEDKSGKVLAKWSWKGAGQALKKWVKCANRL